MAGAAASVSLGWAVDVGIGRDGKTTVVVRDRDGQPVPGATVEVSGFHRSHASTRSPGRWARPRRATTPARSRHGAPGWSTLEVRVIHRRSPAFARSRSATWSSVTTGRGPEGVL
jgi:hypothetical protein